MVTAFLVLYTVVMILITAYEYHYYDDALPFFKVFYGEALKTNPYLKMGIMTGIIRVIKAGIFSDLNNLSVYSILNDFYSDFFGFTQNEVENAIMTPGKLEKYEAIDNLEIELFDKYTAKLEEENKEIPEDLEKVFKKYLNKHLGMFWFRQDRKLIIGK